MVVEIGIIQELKKHPMPEDAQRFSMVSNSPNPLLQLLFSALPCKYTPNSRNLPFSYVISAIFK